MMHKVYNLLGMAMRARCIVLGEGIIKSIQKKQATLIIISNTCGENMRKKLLDKCTYYQVPYIFLDEDMMNHAIGKENRKAISITQSGFAKKILDCTKG